MTEKWYGVRCEEPGCTYESTWLSIERAEWARSRHEKEHKAYHKPAQSQSMLTPKPKKQGFTTDLNILMREALSARKEMGL